MQVSRATTVYYFESGYNTLYCQQITATFLTEDCKSLTIQTKKRKWPKINAVLRDARWDRARARARASPRGWNLYYAHINEVKNLTILWLRNSYFLFWPNLR